MADRKTRDTGVAFKGPMSFTMRDARVVVRQGPAITALPNNRPICGRSPLTMRAPEGRVLPSGATAIDRSGVCSDAVLIGVRLSAEMRFDAGIAADSCSPPVGTVATPPKLCR